jgi:hypothetical protein
MKSRMLTRTSAMVLFAALAIPVSMTAQEEPEGVTRANTGSANPIPLINQPLVPDARKPGGAEFMLTVNGTGFVSASVVKWNGSPLSTTFVSGSQLTAAVPATDIAKANTASVTVVNPSPGGGASNVAFFEVSGANSFVSLRRTDYAVTTATWNVTTGDFNRDGKLDLAIGNNAGNTVSILLGKGDGTFQPPVDYTTGNEPISVATGDFNSDGNQDLAVVNNSDKTVSILLGNGDGTFKAHVEYAVGNNPRVVVAGDLNRDGHLDLAVVNFGDNTVSVLLGNGDGTFKTQTTYAVGPQPGWLVAGDFNGDGNLDLATANFDNYLGMTVSILLGNGDGTFQTHVQYPTGQGPAAIIAADFNGDGKLDLVTSNNGNAISILLGDGDGTFQAPINYLPGVVTAGVTTGDFNGDGKLDLAFSEFNSSLIDVLLGNGDGTFQGPTQYSTGANPRQIAVGDFNGDGRLDLAVANSGENTISALLQDATVSLSKTGLTFADEVVAASSAPQTVKLTNIGVLSLTIRSIAVSGANASDFSQANNCPSSLAPGKSCTITVTFKPIKIGPRSASVTITDNAANSPQMVGLSGTGVTSGPNATLSANSLTFATQLVGTTSPAQSLTLSNYGAMILNISNVAASGDFSETNNCGSSLAPGKSCTISVTFKPKQPGKRTGTSLFTDNAPGSPQTVNLTGAGTDVELVPASLNFGSVTIGQTKSLPTTLTNVGRTMLTINSITITGDPSDFSQTNTCDGSVGAGKSCTITVTFKPPNASNFNGAVSISDTGGGSPQQVSLSGTGVSCGFRQHCGYCEVDSNGNLTGSCVSRSFLCFDIKPSPACPGGQPANQVGVEACSLGTVQVDPTRLCSF